MGEIPRFSAKPTEIQTIQPDRAGESEATLQRDLKAILDGAVGGGLGTASMSVVMLAARQLGLMGEQPPEAITAAALDAGGMNERDAETQDVLASLAHFGFGIGMGALFGLLHRRLPFRVNATVHGVIFGSLVWVTAYQGWVPALGIMPPASRDRPDRPQVMLLAHWVYGATLGMTVAQRTPPAPSVIGH